MAGIYSWVKTIVLFMILLTIVSNLLGKSDFKKYINVVTGLLLVLVTVNPLLNLISGDQGFEYWFESESFELSTTEIASEMRDAQENQQKQIIRRYKDEIYKQIEELLIQRDLYLIDATIQINEDAESEDYAHIDKLTVNATYLAQEETDKTKNKIEKVEISDINILSNDEEAKKEKEVTEDFLSPMEIQVKNMLSDFYNMDGNNINISIQGG